MKNDYKTMCDKCGKKTWYETEQPCKMTILDGCKTCGSREFIYKEVKCTGTLRVIDNSGLNPRAKRFYETGEQVEIVYSNGEKTRCYIGKSTGWKPVYIEIKKRNSWRGEALYLPDDATIRGLGIFKY